MGLPDRVYIGRAGLGNGLRPHPKADESRFHRIICRLVPLLVEGIEQVSEQGHWQSRIWTSRACAPLRGQSSGSNRRRPAPEQPLRACLPFQLVEKWLSTAGN